MKTKKDSIKAKEKPKRKGVMKEEISDTDTFVSKSKSKQKKAKPQKTTRSKDKKSNVSVPYKKNLRSKVAEKQREMWVIDKKATKDDQ